MLPDREDQREKKRHVCGSGLFGQDADAARRDGAVEDLDKPVAPVRQLLVQEADSVDEDKPL